MQDTKTQYNSQRCANQPPSHLSQITTNATSNHLPTHIPLLIQIHIHTHNTFVIRYESDATRDVGLDLYLPNRTLYIVWTRCIFCAIFMFFYYFFFVSRRQPIDDGCATPDVVTVDRTRRTKAKLTTSPMVITAPKTNTKQHWLPLLGAVMLIVLLIFTGLRTIWQRIALI